MKKRNVRFQVVVVVRLKMAVFWVVPCSLSNISIHHPDDGDSKHL
jgi:hypothetical protein